MSWDRLQEDAKLLGRRRPADDLLAAILKEARESGSLEPSLEVGRLLEVLAGGRSVRRILEVGTGTGFATVCLARGAAEAEIVSLDDEDRRFDAVRALLERDGSADRIRLASGDPLELVSRLEGRFERIHLGLEPERSRRLVDRLLPLLEIGGLLTVEGLAPEAAPEIAPEAPAAETARAVAGYLVMHPQLDCIVVPLGRGLGVARKKRPTVTEMGGPF